MSKIAIYIRVSTQHQIDRDSLAVQKRELIDYARIVLNSEDVEIFEDPGFSGKNTDRPAYQEMLSRIRTGEFSHLLVWKIDRISRNLIDFSSMYAELKKCGVAFVSKNEQFDTSTAVGEAMLKIILVFAELERKMTAERVTAVMLSRAENGQWNGGKIPYGYMREDNDFQYRPHEAETVQRIYDMYEEMRSVQNVAKHLNAIGITTRNGTKWSPESVHKILSSPFYTGDYVYNMHDERDAFRKKDASEWIVVQDHHKPIINRAQFDRVSSILKSNGKTSRRYKTTKNVHIFAGLLVCGYCGKNMTTTPGTQRADGTRPSVHACKGKRNGTCPNKYTSDTQIGPFIFTLLQILLTTQELPTPSVAKIIKRRLKVSVEGLDVLRESYDSEPFAMPKEDIVSERDKLLSVRNNIENALTRLKNIYLYSKSSMPEKDYITEHDSLTKQLESVNEKIASCPSESEEAMIRASYYLMIDKISKGQFDYEKHLTYMNRLPLQRFVRSVIKSITVKDGFVTQLSFSKGNTLKFVATSK